MSHNRPKDYSLKFVASLKHFIANEVTDLKVIGKIHFSITVGVERLLYRDRGRLLLR